MVYKLSNVYESCTKVYFFYKLFGATPYSLYPKRQLVLFERRNIFANITVITAMLTTWFISREVCLSGKEDTEDVTFIFYDFRSSLTLVGQILLWINCQVNAKKLKLLFEKFKALDESLVHLTKDKCLYFFERSKWLFPFMCGRHVTFGIFATLEIAGKVYCNEDPNFVCLISSYILYALMEQSMLMYLALMCESWKRINFLNDFLRRITVRQKMIFCIEITMMPKANVCYKLEELRLIYLKIEDLVIYINQIFQVGILTKVVAVNLSVINCAFEIAETLYVMETQTQAAVIIIPLLYWAFSVTAVVIADIYIYNSVVLEVCNVSEAYLSTVKFCNN